MLQCQSFDFCVFFPPLALTASSVQNTEGAVGTREFYAFYVILEDYPALLGCTKPHFLFDKVTSGFKRSLPVLINTTIELYR